MTVVFSQAAKDDLEQIADYIAKDNPRRALSFVKEPRSAALGLGDMPRAFPLVPAMSIVTFVGVPSATT